MAKTRTNPVEFIQQVRREVSKVTWPSRRETTVSTIMVFIFVTLTAVFFFLVDQALAVLVKLVLGFGG
jgi:preprotein translocase subunit SecE